MPNASETLLLLTFGLVFYTLGASVVEGLVNYRTWCWIGADSFPAYHRAVGPRIIAYLVAPFGASVLLTLGLIAWRPPAIPLLPVLISLALDVVAIIATLGWQLPTQRALDRSGRSDILIARLIRMEWFRLIPHLLNALLFLWFVGRMVSVAQGAAP